MSFYSYASKKAVTEEGDVVILKNDGTWVYENGKAEEAIEVPLNPNVFTKPSASKFKIKSSKTDANFWINPKAWKFEKNKNGEEPSEYTFTLKGEDLYAMAITERLQMKLPDLINQALSNAQDVAPDTKIITQEYRMVNGHKVMFLHMEGTIQSVKFGYLGYYHSNDSGVTQYLTYTGANLVNGYRDEIFDFLNGFTVFSSAE